jgi:hypothetical protein
VKKTVTGCKTDSDCKAPTAKCKVSTGKCVECLSDGDCSGGKKCENEVCKDVGTGCQNCGVDEFCFENEKCIPKFKSCQAATDCKTNETCVGITQTSAICLINCDTRKNTSKDNLLNPECYGGYGECLGVSQTDPNKGACVPPRKAKRGWKESCGDFLNPDKPSYHNCKDSDTMCVNTGEAAFCWKKCDPAKNDANKKNPGCEAGQGVCHALQSGGGVCEPVRPKTQNKGDKCLTGDPSDPTWADCKEGLMCKSGVCADAPKKTRKLSESCLLSNPADPGYDDCIDGLICSANKCVDKCDINKATPATNPDCPPGFFCSGTGANTMCKALPEKKTSGTKQLGEDCSNVTAANFCDPSKDLFCNFPKCAKACDPRQGTTTNPSCTANEECVEITTYSHLGGGCLPKPSQQKGAVCNTTDKRCIAGLTCYWDHCGQTCDAAKPQPSDCASDEWCITAGKVCAKKCDPANGTSTNTACGQGTYCAAHSTTYKPGHCRPLPSKKQGPKQLGEDCSNYTTTSFCDGSKNYFCNFRPKNVLKKSCTHFWAGSALLIPHKKKTNFAIISPNAASQALSARSSMPLLAQVCANKPAQLVNRVVLAAQSVKPSPAAVPKEPV